MLMTTATAKTGAVSLATLQAIRGGDAAHVTGFFRAVYLRSLGFWLHFLHFDYRLVQSGRGQTFVDIEIRVAL